MKGIQLLNSGFDTADLFFEANIAYQEKFSKLILEKRFKIKDTDTSYRVINHWCEKDLIEDSRNEATNKWRTFSLTDLVWIQTISDLREFGTPLTTIKNIKHNLFNECLAVTFSNFHIYLLLAMQGIQTSIVLYKGGENAIGTRAQVLKAIEMDNFPTHLTVSVNSLVEHIFKKKSLNSTKETLETLSNNEKSVLNTLREKGIEKVNVSLKNGKITHIEKADSIPLNEAIAEISGKNKYQTITTKYESGKKTHVKRKVMNKLQ